MTDNEKTKALECCIEGDCDNCPYDEQTACNEYMKQDCLDLINCQKADYDRLQKANLRNQEIFAEQSLENERLKAENERLEHQIETLCLTLKLAKAEAYKEFAEKLENRILSMLTTATLEEKEIICACIGIKNNVLKEMVGE